MKPFSFSVNKQAPKPEPSSLKRPALFGSTDDDHHIDAAPTAASSSKSSLSANKAHIAQATGTSKAQKKRMEAEKLLDSSVYEYDEVWDTMQASKQRQKEAKDVESTQRKPKYIEGFLATAATRRLDRLRAEEKMMQREREAEGDEFADKDKFVTQAYKDQMAEVRKAEEEERAREVARLQGTTPSSGMTHFYAKLLNETELDHEATVAATQKRVKGAAEGPNLTIQKPPSLDHKSDLELANAARAEGKEVELNDDNQIVDKTTLLSAGLNLAAPNTRVLASTKHSGGQGGEDVKVHTAVGTAASRQEINARRARELKRQMEEEEVRVMDEKVQREQEDKKRTLAQRNDDGDVQSAKERYLARKRQKLEQPPPREDDD